jgi:hypothetical protein
MCTIEERTRRKEIKCIIINYFHSPSTIQSCHDSLAYMYVAYPINDVNVLLFMMT